ncbi:SpaH/EbpB family LPXTG-anchored major pilin [Allofournierella massiliensis]|uniref:SpaH/EbpB family LPXTG-anchored major pilin n=1 Tax=Allofournierella massiliensis TaxID=1650663 RepID=UPI00356A0A55
MKLFKRAATFCMAAAMALSLSVTAFAAGNGGDRTLTVTGDTLDNKKVFAVQMFDARVEGTGDNYTFDSYVLADEDWLTFFTTDTGSGGVGLTDQDSDGDVDTDDARAYVESLQDQNLADFANKAQAWVRSHSSNFTVLEVTASNDSATFAELKAGYYLVYPEGGSTGNDSRGTDAMLVNVPRDNNAEWHIKSVFPTVDKKVDTDNEGAGDPADNGSAQVGDVVTFTLTSAVPDMSDYDTFYFAFNDTLSNGLKVVNNAGQDVEDGTGITLDSLTVTIGGKSVTNGYTVNLSSNSLEIEFTDLKTATIQDGTITTGAAIVVTYKAMITEAATTTNPANNEVKVEYSNDPSNTTHGTSTPDETDVYTYEIKVNKWATDAGGQTGNLAGAKFILSTSATAPTADEIADDYVSYTGIIKLIGSGNAYRVAKPGEEGAVTSFTTTATGDITISGLEGSTDPGTTYYLHEIEAPAGYNKLKDPVAIVIIITDLSTGTATITVNGNTATGDGNTTVDVENKKGIELPETGSIGTIGLTVAGVAVVLAGVMLPRKKKNKEQE